MYMQCIVRIGVVGDGCHVDIQIILTLNHPHLKSFVIYPQFIFPIFNCFLTTIVNFRFSEGQDVKEQVLGR